MLPGLKERSEERRKRMVWHVAQNFAEAEEWDLEFWQQQTPQDRLSALAAIHRDVEAVQHTKKKSDASKKARAGKR